jgi:hypothetical protein
LEGQLDVDIGLKERSLDVANDLREERVVNGRAPRDLLEHRAQGFAE